MTGILVFSVLTVTLLNFSEWELPKFNWDKMNLTQMPKRWITHRKIRKAMVQRNYLLLAGLRAELISGATPQNALEFMVLTHFVEELPHTRNALETFQSVAEGLRRDAQQTFLFGIDQLAIAWDLSQETGAPLASLVEQIVMSLETEEKRKSLIQTETASVKATVYVLAALPLVGIFLAAMLGINVVAWFVSGPLGLACFFSGVVFEVIGVLWVRRMINVTSPSIGS